MSRDWLWYAVNADGGAARISLFGRGGEAKA